MNEAKNRPVRAALYARVSTTDQDARMQLEELRELAAQRLWNLTGVYVDHSSGAIRERPQLERMMADARRGRFDLVAVWKFDRFARSTTHLLAALEEFRSLNIDFISHREAIDTSTHVGKMVFVVVAAVAELERNLIRERVQAGIDRAKRNGKQLGRPKSGADPHVVQELQSVGLSQRQIARKLGVSRSTVARLLQKPS